MTSRNALRVGANIFVVLIFTTSIFSQNQQAATPGSVRGAKFQPLNVKPGLWEGTRSYKRVGTLPLPAGMLARLTPEQRARLEQRMKASSDAAARTEADKTCITKEELQKPMRFDDKQCIWTILESSGTKVKGRVSCEEQGIKLTGDGEFEAPDQEHMQGSVHLVSSGGGNNMTVDGTFNRRWVGPSCGNVR